MQSQSISTWACGDRSKVVISLDLDLFEKIYPMVHSDLEMRKRYILCLGELHAVFAHIRAIGAWHLPDWIVRGKEFSKELFERGNNILNLIKKSHISIASDDREEFRISWNNFLVAIESLELDTKLHFVLEKKKSNKLLQFLMGLVHMVDGLFSFIEASRTRDWLKHLSAAEALIQDFCSMNRIKYRRMWTVYIADMRSLETSSLEVWEAFMDGDFSI